MQILCLLPALDQIHPVHVRDLTGRMVPPFLRDIPPESLHMGALPLFGLDTARFPVLLREEAVHSHAFQNDDEIHGMGAS